MAFAAAAPWIFAGLMAGSAAYAGYQKKQAGLATQYEYQAQARQEKLAARDREIKRRQQLLASLAQRSAQIGASGTGFEGSPSALLINDFSQYEMDNTVAAAQSSATQASLRQAGKNAASLGRMGFVGGLLEAGTAAAGAPWGGKINPDAGSAPFKDLGTG